MKSGLQWSFSQESSLTVMSVSPWIKSGYFPPAVQSAFSRHHIQELISLDRSDSILFRYVHSLYKC